MKKNKTNILTFTALGLILLVLATACLPAASFNSVPSTINSHNGQVEEEKVEIETSTARIQQNIHMELEQVEEEKVEIETSTARIQQNIDMSLEIRATEEASEKMKQKELERQENEEEASRIEARLLHLLQRDYSTTVGKWSEDVANLQSILGIAQDGLYGLITRDAHLDALRERNLSTDTIPEAFIFEEKTETNDPMIPIVELSEASTCSGVTCFAGYEGENQLIIEAAAAALPLSLRQVISGTAIVNGCHPYGKVTLGHCAYGTWDSAGWGADGEHGHEWAMTVWVSNRGVNSGHLGDIITHEAGHAYSYIIARTCSNPETGKSYRDDARTLFGGEEQFADAITAYFTGGAFQHYRGNSAGLSEVENTFLAQMLEHC